ncbi:uroporphyrinogen-III C-methyltransferase [Neosynechococcus sphagnicola]|uniref:uroporphyrinogen-III C-methyltransferase n=1 Tax=Neosynechococcus sphagnicola TaxID=1501145 RepID=UPI000565E567|nr:uroporphyrinogen-III C-methyltransferase [Neosynechococcus sphagnicola]
MTEQVGMVYIVGAGPGDISCLTLRALQILDRAEVLVYDALIDSRVLALVPKDCCILQVGKRAGQPSTPQTEINRLLVDYCQQGKRVVRLKSGDPFVFGRCADELQALIDAGCGFEVVPGLSSALAAPCLAGIPLTDPLRSRCFAVVTAHEPAALNWPALAQIETLVSFDRGGKVLGEIVHQLQHLGRSPKMPIAILRWASHPQEQVWISSLGTVVADTVGKSLAPAVIVIGEVVNLRTDLQPLESRHPPIGTTLAALVARQWLPPVSDPVLLNPSVSISISMTATEPLPPLPLRGKTILVTRAAGQSSQFCQQLQQQGATVLEMPALEIQPPGSWEALDRAIAQLTSYSWLILTSANGVDYFFQRLATLGKDVRGLAGVKIAVVGEKTALSLQQRGLQPDFIPPHFIADALVTHFPEPVRGQRILFPRVETGGREVLVQELTAQGAIVIEVAAYQSGCPPEIEPAVSAALQTRQIDIITFASSKTVACCCQLLGTQATELLKSVLIASIGPQTSQACRRLLGRVDIEAKNYTLEGLTQAISESMMHADRTHG